MYIKSLFVGLVAISLTGCLKTDDDVTYGQCSAPDANNRLYDFLDDEYFWYDDLAQSFNPEKHTDIKEALASLRVAQDRFSFAMTTAEYDDYQKSVFFGYGFSHTATENNDGLKIRYVFEEGSAAQNGLRRGDVIIGVDGVDMATILSQVSAGTTTLTTVFGPNEEGHTIDVEILKPDGSTIDTQFSKGSITANTVMATQVKDVTIAGEAKKVGYLVFDSFDSRSEQELNVAFDEFAAQNIDEMILDVRYNGGGLIRVAKQLSTQIAGDEVENEVFVKYVHNDKQSSRDQTSYFSLGAGFEKMNLDRVVVLTTGGSCSASELVINALDPFVEVVIVGENTCGKPVGMYPEEICDHVVFAINFQTQNAAGFGDYFDGLSVDCPVNDVVTGDWGVESDPLLAEGLHYLVNDSCSASAVGSPHSRNGAAQAKFKPSAPVDFSEGPIKAKNLL